MFSLLLIIVILEIDIGNDLDTTPMNKYTADNNTIPMFDPLTCFRSFSVSVSATKKKINTGMPGGAES